MQKRFITLVFAFVSVARRISPKGITPVLVGKIRKYVLAFVFPASHQLDVSSSFYEENMN